MVAYLDISPDQRLRLPAHEAQTQTLVVYGAKGQGKSNFTRLFGEQLARHSLKFSLIDPIGVNWGLKHSADGKGPGIEVLILGGIHADLPIEPTAGAVVADFVVDEDVSVVIDISRHADGRMWSMGEKVRFVRDYCIRLFERQGERRRPLMQLIDEAGRFVPQQMPKGSTGDDIAACMGAIEQLVEWGRNVGVGVALITQRSARMNKSVSELAEMMIAFRTVGPRSIDAIIDWFGEHVPKAQQNTFIEMLRKLKVGHALVVSPGWLEVEGEYTIAKATTFDSSATPRAGQERRPTGKGTVIDLDAYRNRMVETVEKAEARDPRKLQDRLVKAEKQTKAMEARVAGLVEDIQALEAERDALAERVSELEEGGAAKQEAEALLDQAAERVRAIGEEIGGRLQELADLLGTSVIGSGQKAKSKTVKTRVPSRPAPARAVPTPAPAQRVGPADTSVVNSSRQKILDAIAWYANVGVVPASRGHVAFVAGTSPNSSGFEKNVSSLRTAGLIDYPTPGTLGLTAAGEAIANPSAEIATTKELVDELERRLGKSKGRILREVVKAYPSVLTRSELASRCEVSEESSGFEKNISGLRSLGFVDYPQPGSVVATTLLFLDAQEVA